MWDMSSVIGWISWILGALVFMYVIYLARNQTPRKIGIPAAIATIIGLALYMGLFTSNTSTIPWIGDLAGMIVKFFTPMILGLAGGLDAVWIPKTLWDVRKGKLPTQK